MNNRRIGMYETFSMGYKPTKQKLVKRNDYTDSRIMRTLNIYLKSKVAVETLRIFTCVIPLLL